MNTTRNIWIGVGAVIVVALIGWWTLSSPSDTATTGDTAEEAAVRDVVTKFGANMQKVSVHAPVADAAAAIASAYGPYISGDLLSRWQANPASAAGRVTSSPWPDHIAIGDMKKNLDGSYTVSGEVVEVTSIGIADTYPITLTVANVNGWRITSVAADVNNKTMAPVPTATTTPSGTEIYKG